MFDKHAGETCGGALLEVVDAAAFRSFETGLAVVETARRLSGDAFRWRSEPYEFDPRPAIDLLTGSARCREILESGGDLAAEILRHAAGAREFQARREPHLLYPDRRPAAVAFVGAHNAGKTSLIVSLLPILAARGVAVGTVKHSSRDAEDDIEGKDSRLHAEAGARVASFVTPGRTTSRRFGPEEEVETLLAREFSSCDLVLVEGYKGLPIPKIEVARAGVQGVPVAGALARVCDFAAKDDLPTFRFEERDRIADAVLRLAGWDRPAR
jgi:molybdopterin-guanine dinucleotide biosynthesis protein MobB